VGEAATRSTSAVARSTAPRSRRKKGQCVDPNPTDRGKPGSKRHVLVDANGIPLAFLLSAANVHDSCLFEPLLDAVPPIRQCAGRPRKRPGKLQADKGYDYDCCRRAARRRGIEPRIARRGIESSERLGRHRWVVERTLAWFARFRRLTVRYERRVDLLLAFHLLAAALICLGFVRRWFCWALGQGEEDQGAGGGSWSVASPAKWRKSATARLTYDFSCPPNNELAPAPTRARP
jgi:transposase